MDPMLPPKRAIQFLRWICRDDLIEEFEGDLHECYIRLRKEHPRSARLRFFGLVLRYVRPEFIRSSRLIPNNPFLMFRHNFTLSYRNFLRHKTVFFINLAGLSTGLACMLLIYLWVADEYRTDRSFDHNDQLFQVMKTSRDANGTIETHETTPPLLADALADEIPEITTATNVFNRNSGVVSVNNKRIKGRVAFAGKDFFRVFSFVLADENKAPRLSNKYGVYLSRALAEKFFDSPAQAVGKTINWSGEQLDGSYIVAGVFEEPANNHSMQFDILFPYALHYDTFKDRYGLDKWYSNSPSTYVVIQAGTDINALNEKIADFAKKKYAAAHGKVHENEGIIFLQGYADKYLNGHYENGQPAGGRIDYIRILSFVAIVILIVACVNFMNLSTAQAMRRVKEAGVKKVVGASTFQLVIQHITESILMASMALTVAVLLVALVLPQFNIITGKQLILHPDRELFAFLLLVTLFSGIFAGCYPAFYMARFNPISILKGSVRAYSGKYTQALVKNGLVAFQLCASVMLVVAVMIIYQQITFIQTRNLGFSKDNVTMFPVEGEMKTRLDVFMAGLKRIPGVTNASCAMGDLVGMHGGGGGIDWPGKRADQGVEFAGIDVDGGFAATLNIKMSSGRFFNNNITNEAEKVIFNQAAIDAMQLKDPIGQVVRMWGSEKQIIGVVDNFHFESMYNRVGPFFMRYTNNQAMSIFAKLEAGREQQALAEINKYYNDFNRGLPFDYHFVDDDFNKLYASELQVSMLSRYFAGIALLVSCLGLFALSAFAAHKRVKEIGIRKTMGSGEWRIVSLLTAEFTWMAIIAISIGVPLSYYFAQEWLNTFAYHITLKAGYFLVAAASTLLITWATVGINTWRAAKTNPASALRHE